MRGVFTRHFSTDEDAAAAAGAPLAARRMDHTTAKWNSAAVDPLLSSSGAARGGAGQRGTALGGAGWRGETGEDYHRRKTPTVTRCHFGHS